MYLRGLYNTFKNINKICLLILFFTFFCHEIVFPFGEEYETDATGKGGLSLTDVRFAVINNSSVRVSGKISRCYYATVTRVYEKKTTYLRQRVGRDSKGIKYVINYNRPTGHKLVLKKTNSPRYTDYMPRKLAIKNPFGQDVEAEVLRSGDFSAVISIDSSNSKYSFTKPSPLPFYSVYKFKTPRKIKLIASPPENYETKPRTERGLVVWFLDINEDKIEDKVKRTIHIKPIDIQINFHEKNTHIDVRPEIIITGIDVKDRNYFINNWKDYCKNNNVDNEIFRIGKKYITLDYLREGEKLRKKSTSISFKGLQGSKYRVETKHPDYYYYSGLLSVDESAEKLKRSVLLIEVGEKLRNEFEGQGAVMVED